MSVLDDAIRLSAKLPVFPCLPDKRPACQRGFKDAVKGDAAAVVDLWRKHPGQLIGVPTGAVSGFDVLDIDPRHGGDEWLTEAIDRLPSTRWHHTRSGGVHLLFRHVGGLKNTAGKVAPGVDTRGDGGYVIWWPSSGCEVKNPTALAPWPGWLIKMVMPPKVKRQFPPPLPATRIEADARAMIMINRAYARVRDAKPGQRHYELRAAAATLGGLHRYLKCYQYSVEEELVNIIMATGAESREAAMKTAHWAFEKGAVTPLLQRKS